MAYSSTSDAFRKLVLMGFLLLLCCAPAATAARAEGAGIPDDVIRTARSDTELVRRYAEQLLEENRKDNYAHGGFTWDTEGRETSWRYFNGFMADALLRSGGEKGLRFAEAFYPDQILPDGSIPDYLPGYLDSVEPARALFRLISGPENAGRYREAIRWVYARLESQTAYLQCGGNYLHHQEEDGTPAKDSIRYPIFLDGLYMTQPFLAECSAALRRGEITLTDRKGREIKADRLEAEILNRYAWLRAYLYNPEKKLYQHGWNPRTGSGNGHYWGRGIGWLAMSLADTAELMPEGPVRDRITELLRELLDGMLLYQDPATGLWYNVVDRGPELEGNRTETSVSCMMAYALVKAWNNGYVSDDRYLLCGLRAFRGVIDGKTEIRDGRIHVRDTYLKSGVGDTDEYYCKEKYTEDEAKGTAAMLMASAETEKALRILQER